MKTRIDIDTQTFVRFWLVVIGFALAALIIYSARTALIIIGVAFFLALALNKPVSALANILPGKSRVGGTAIAYIIIVLLLGSFLVLVVPPVIEQTAKVAQSLPTIIDTAQNQWHGLNGLLTKYGLESQVNNALDSFKDNIGKWATGIGGNVISSLSSILGLFTATLLVLVLSFLMLIEAPRWLERIWGVYEDEERMEYHKTLATRMYNVVTGYVTGQLTVSGIGAIFTAIVVFILSFLFNIPHNIALPAAAIAFVLSLIPMFGATIGGFLIFLLLVFNDPTAAVIYAVYFVIYQQIENNFISPTIQAKTVELSALAVLGSVTVGLYLFGVAGGIISIPIAGCLKVLIEDHLERARAKRHRRKQQSVEHKLAKADT